jgi:hypothetical protein
MKALLKRYAAAACALICALTLAGAWTGVRLSAGSDVCRLDDIEGDAAYLDGVRIGMTVSDAAYTQHITLDSGALSRSFSYPSPLYKPGRLLYSGSQAFAESPDADVRETSVTTLESSGEDYELWLTRLTRTANEVRVSVAIDRHSAGGSNFSSEWAQVVTNVTVSGEGHPFSFNLERETTVYTDQFSAQGAPLPDTTSETPFSYTETQIDPVSDIGYSATPLYARAGDGTVYFTPSLMPYYGGTSAIYRVDEWSGEWGRTEASATVDGHPCFPDGNAVPVGRVTELAAFPAGGLRILALDVADDKLCLLLAADDILTLRVYGLDGALQYETPLPEIDPEQELTSTLFSNESGDVTMLCYYLQDGSVHSNLDQPQFQPMLLGIRLCETAELMSMITARDTVMRAAFIDGHWVLAEVEHVDYSIGESIIPERYYVSVLDAAGATLYRGEVITDAYEDEIQHYISTGTEHPGEETVSRWLSIDAITEG